MNLTQLINSPTRPDKSTLIDIILTNIPHKYSVVGVFCNDLSDHCAVVAVRNTKIPKTNLREMRNVKYFNEQELTPITGTLKFKSLPLSLETLSRARLIKKQGPGLCL